MEDTLEREEPSMDGVTHKLGRLLTLVLVFGYAYMLAEVFGHAYGLAPGIFPLLAALGVTLVVGGAWQWFRASQRAAT
ncbi:MAG TPA: hypothetical protein VD767_10640 [Thermomicrobiales bacterium]|nr:hypothetical protein [Thermomicrobiales bacterium]